MTAATAHHSERNARTRESTDLVLRHVRALSSHRAARSPGYCFPCKAVATSRSCFHAAGSAGGDRLAWAQESLLGREARWSGGCPQKAEGIASWVATGRLSGGGGERRGG